MSFLKSKKFIIIFFTLVGIAIYANSFNNQMFWDDDDGILNNQFVHNFEFSKFFSENLIAGSGLVSNYWRPLLLTVFSIEWHLWGDSPIGYHLINTLFHILNTVLLYSITVKLFKNRLLSFLSCIIFLIHPLQTEAVTYVSGLADPLSVFFILASAYFLLKFRDSGKPLNDSKYVIYYVILYIFALLTKDSAVMGVGVIGLIDFFYLPHHLSLKEKTITVSKAIWPLLLATGIYLLLRGTTLNFQNTFNLYNETNQFTGSFIVRLLTFYKVLATYFGLLFWPNNLHMERSIEIATNLSSPQTLTGILLFVGLISVAIKTYKKNPIITFGILWFFIALFPHSNLLVPTAGLLYEHWLYLPMVGVWLIVFWVPFALRLSPARWPDAWRSSRQARTAMLTIILVYSIFLSSKTIARNRDWKDPIIFYNQTLKYSPNSYRVVNNLGMAYADVKDYENAQKTYERAIEIDPSIAVAHHNLGNNYKETGSMTLAEQEFFKAIELQPDFIFSYNALLNMYSQQKEYQKISDLLEKYPNPVQAEKLREYFLAQ